MRFSKHMKLAICLSAMAIWSAADLHSAPAPPSPGTSQTPNVAPAGPSIGGGAARFGGRRLNFIRRGLRLNIASQAWIGAPPRITSRQIRLSARGFRGYTPTLPSAPQPQPVVAPISPTSPPSHTGGSSGPAQAQVMVWVIVTPDAYAYHDDSNCQKHRPKS